MSIRYYLTIVSYVYNFHFYIESININTFPISNFLQELYGRYILNSHQVFPYKRLIEIAPTRV